MLICTFAAFSKKLKCQESIIIKEKTLRLWSASKRLACSVDSSSAGVTESWQPLKKQIWSLAGLYLTWHDLKTHECVFYQISSIHNEIVNQYVRKSK